MLPAGSKIMKIKRMPGLSEKDGLGFSALMSALDNAKTVPVNSKKSGSCKVACGEEPDFGNSNVRAWPFSAE